MALAPLALMLSLTLAAPSFDLTEWNRQRLQSQSTGMWVLGGWGAANIVAGGLGAALTHDEQLRWVFLGSALWNTVNLALAVINLASNWKADPASFDAKASLQASNSSSTIFAVNAGIDFGYLATGAFLWQRGASTQDPRMVGVGQALLIQGAFLAVFDTVMALVLGGFTNRLVDHLNLSVDQSGLGGSPSR